MHTMPVYASHFWAQRSAKQTGCGEETNLYMPASDLFNAQRLPARIDIEQTGRLLGFHPDSVDHLVSIRMLNMLGGPAPGVARMFASTYILELCSDVPWLDKATKRIRQHHAAKNAAQKGRRTLASTNEPGRIRSESTGK